MAFDKRSLARFATSPYGTASKSVGFFTYATADANATLLTNGYFNNARETLKVNDVIHSMSVADGVGVANVLKVTAVPGSGDVTVANAFAAPT